MKLEVFTRNHFFPGKILTVEDFNLEQQYHREKQKLHNRFLHGFGIVGGLRVAFAPGPRGSARAIQITAGLALDCEGNELVVPEIMSVTLPGCGPSPSVAFLGIKYVEKRTTPVSIEATETDYGHIEESVVAFVENENNNRGHSTDRGQWSACGLSHGLTIARLRSGLTGWRVDRGYRPPMVK